MTTKEMLEFMDHIRRPDDGMFRAAKPLKLIGSVQAGHAVYSKPMQDDCDWYEYVEVGFPDRRPSPAIEEYAQGNIYPYVPVELVFEWIDSLGGWEKVKP